MSQPPDPLPDQASRAASAAVYVVSDPGALAAMSAALRERGYGVSEVPLERVAERVAEQRPAAIVFDAALDGVLGAAERLCETPGGLGLETVFVGVPAGAADGPGAELFGRLASRVIPAGSAPSALVEALDDIVRGHTGLESLRIVRAGGATADLGAAEQALLAGILAPGSDDAASADKIAGAIDSSPLPGSLDSAPFPSTSSNPPPMGLGPLSADGFDAIGWSKGAFAGPTQWSGDLERLLRAADEQLAGGDLAGSDVPSPEDEVNAILPPEVLAALDDALDAEGPESAGSGASGTRTPTGGGTGGERVAKEALQPAVAADRPATGDIETGGGTGGGGEDSDDAEGAAEPPPSAERGEPTRPPPGDDEGSWRDDAAREPPAARTPATLPPPTRAVAPPESPRQPVSSDERRHERTTSHGAPLTPSSPSDSAAVALPPVLGPELDGLRALAACIASRATATLCLEHGGTLRRAVLREGDFVACASSEPHESLLEFLVARGDVPREMGHRLRGKLPAFGRHAAAALIAHGHLGQDQLWAVLRAHAEWLLGRMAALTTGTCTLEAEPPGRLKAEPAAFGGATGAEVLVEVARRVFDAGQAVARLGGRAARLGDGSRKVLLAECALDERESHAASLAPGRSVHEVLEAAGEEDFAPVLVALAELGVLEILPSIGDDAGQGPHGGADGLDAEAVRRRIAARMAIVEEGDYFAVLGVPRAATSYAVRKAYLEMRRSLEPSRLLTVETADLLDDVRTVLEVVEEAYEVLREPARRERYRRALEGAPPRGK